MIRVVSLDIDDTLYDFNTASRRGLEFVTRRIREEIGESAAALDADTVIEDLVAMAERMEHPYARLVEFRRRAFALTLARFNSHDGEGPKRAALLDELNEIYLRRRFENVSPYDGVREILQELGESYVVCAVSNGEQDLGRLGLEGLFAFVVLASDVGYQKPDPRIFEAAMRRTDCSPEEFAHVGDSEVSDVGGARAAGAWAIWYNPSGRERRPGPTPHCEIRTLSELPLVLAGLKAGDVEPDTTC